MILFLGIVLAFISAFFGGILELGWLFFLQINGGLPVPRFFSQAVYGILLAGLVFHLCTISRWWAIDCSNWPRMLRPTAKTLIFGAPLFIGMFGVTLSYLVLCGSISVTTVLIYCSSLFGWEWLKQFRVNVNVTTGKDSEIPNSPEAAHPVEPGSGGYESPPVSEEVLAEMEAKLHQAFEWIEWGSSFFGCLLVLLLVSRLRLPVFWHISNVVFMSLVAMFRSARKSDQKLPDVVSESPVQSGPVINLQPEWLDCIPVILGALVFWFFWRIRIRKSIEP